MNRSIAWFVRLTATLLLLVASSLAITLSAQADEPEPTPLDGPVTAFDVAVTPESLPTLDVTVEEESYAPEGVVLTVDAEGAETGHQLGWSTMRLPEGDQAVVGLEVTGPGQVIAEEVDEDGGRTVLLDSTDSTDDELVLPAASHGWPLWTFSQPGEYQIEATPQVRSADGTVVDGEPTRYVVEVAPPDGPGEGEDPGDPGDTDDPGDADGPGDTGGSDDVVEPTTPEKGGTSTSGGDKRVRAAADDDDRACEVPGLPDDAVRVSDGHFDYGVQVEGGKLTSLVKDDRPSPAIWRSPGTMLFELGEAAKMDVPDNAEFSFLGEPGEEIWTIGQTQQPDVPWLGWNTQHPSAIGNIDGGTTWKVEEVEGPGDVFVYQIGSFGDLAKMMSPAAGWPDSITIPANTHAHGNWSFTEPGIYRIDTTHAAKLTSGQTVSSSGTLTFRVGPCAQDAPDDPPADGGKKDAEDTQDTAGKNNRTPSDAPPPGSTPAPSSEPVKYCTPTSKGPGSGTSDSDDNGSTPGGNGSTRQSSVSEGHFDYGPNIVNGALVARVKDDRTQPPKWVPPESLRFVLGSASRQQVPSGPAYSFLGKPDDPIWLIPQTQVSGVPWLGWNTQHESVRSEVKGSVRFTLDGVSGPGDLAVYLTDSFGGVGEKVFGNVSGFPRSFNVPLNVHAHGNWAFTSPGTYQVTITQSATLKSGRSVSDSSTLTFVVGGGSGGGGQSLGLMLPLVGQASAAPLTPASAAGEKNCVLPKAGADDSLTLLLPLGLTLVVSGAALLVVRRRAARV